MTRCFEFGKKVLVYWSCVPPGGSLGAASITFVKLPPEMPKCFDWEKGLAYT
ncbi:hypothetical protein B0H19DRAFT_1187952 [Mycena capillaripes]|nr:hypothetical protein B0H19DRAFT_1187952 [Mycena capillaripes]